MAYGDQLRVSVRSTGDFRFERRPEEEIDEVGLLAGSIELSLDELESALEVDTRGIAVRDFIGTQRHLDAGADGYMVDFVVNVAADVSVLGLTGTVAYVRSRIKAREQAAREQRIESLGRDDYERAAQEALIRKFDIPVADLQTMAVEYGSDGIGEVEIQIPSDSRKFTVYLKMHADGLREYRLRCTG